MASNIKVTYLLKKGVQRLTMYNTGNVTTPSNGSVKYIPNEDETLNATISGQYFILVDGVAEKDYEITIQMGFTGITTSPFNNNEGIISVDFSEYSVNYLLPEGMFMGCKNITEFIDTNSHDNIKISSDNRILYSYSTDTLTLTIVAFAQKRSDDSNETSYTIEVPYFQGRNSVRIGNHAFYNCEWLTSISLNNTYGYSLTIGDYAFSNCINLSEIADSLQYAEEYGSSAFSGCKSLNNFNFGSNASVIGDYLFYGCESLCDVEMDNTNITGISNSMFSGCINLTSVTINSETTSIGDYAFSGCKSLMSITMPDTITDVSGGVFENCINLTGVTISTGITEITNSMFNNCNRLQTIEIPNGITSIGYNAFSYCYSLTNITIPNSVASIGGMAFFGCSNLEYVTINNDGGDIEIGNGVFSKCYSLNKFNGKYATNDGKFLVKDNKILSSAINGQHSLIIPDGITGITEYSFYGCGLTQVTLPQSIVSIGNDAFRENYLIKITSKRNTPPEIQYGSFGGINYGGDLYCHNSALDEYETQWLNKNSRFENWNIHPITNDVICEYYVNESNDTVQVANSIDDVSILGMKVNGVVSNTMNSEMLFENSGINEVTFQIEGTKIPNSLFSGVTNLIRIKNIASGIEDIGNNTFSDCKNLFEVNIGNGVSTIGEKAFNNCIKLNNIICESKNDTIKINEDSFNNVKNNGFIFYYNNDSENACKSLSDALVNKGWVSKKVRKLLMIDDFKQDNLLLYKNETTTVNENQVAYDDMFERRDIVFSYGIRNLSTQNPYTIYKFENNLSEKHEVIATVNPSGGTAIIDLTEHDIATQPVFAFACHKCPDENIYSTNKETIVSYDVDTYDKFFSCAGIPIYNSDISPYPLQYVTIETLFESKKIQESDDIIPYIQIGGYNNKMDDQITINLFENDEYTENNKTYIELSLLYGDETPSNSNTKTFKEQYDTSIDFIMDTSDEYDYLNYKIYFNYKYSYGYGLEFYVSLQDENGYEHYVLIKDINCSGKDYLEDGDSIPLFMIRPYWHNDDKINVYTNNVYVKLIKL